MPSTVLSALQLLTHLILITLLSRCYPPFIFGEIEAQRDFSTFPKAAQPMGVIPTRPVSLLTPSYWHPHDTLG